MAGTGCVRRGGVSTDACLPVGTRGHLSSVLETTAQARLTGAITTDKVPRDENRQTHRRAGQTWTETDRRTARGRPHAHSSTRPHAHPTPTPTRTRKSEREDCTTEEGEACESARARARMRVSEDRGGEMRAASDRRGQAPTFCVLTAWLLCGYTDWRTLSLARSLSLCLPVIPAPINPTRKLPMPPSLLWGPRGQWALGKHKASS